jgi:hypothetical protein
VMSKAEREAVVVALLTLNAARNLLLMPVDVSSPKAREQMAAEIKDAIHLLSESMEFPE